MSDKSVSDFTKIPGGADTEKKEIDTPPAGEVWVVTDFGGADVNIGDSMSSIFWLEWDGSVIPDSIIVVTGSSENRKGNWELVGDGAKKLEIRRQRVSSTDKQVPWWVRGYKRS